MEWIGGDMIRVKLTENYTGFNIQGTFDDFYELYAAISHFIGFEKKIRRKFRGDIVYASI